MAWWISFEWLAIHHNHTITCIHPCTTQTHNSFEFVSSLLSSLTKFAALCNNSRQHATRSIASHSLQKIPMSLCKGRHEMLEWIQTTPYRPPCMSYPAFQHCKEVTLKWCAQSLLLVAKWLANTTMAASCVPCTTVVHMATSHSFGSAHNTTLYPGKKGRRGEEEMM